MPLFFLDMGKSEEVSRMKLIRFYRKHATGISPIEMNTVHVERGMIWQEAVDKYVFNRIFSILLLCIEIHVISTKCFHLNSD